MNVAMAITPSRIIGYAYKPRSSGIKLKKRIAEWPRHSVHVQIAAPQKARGFPHVIFGFPDGSRIELEIPQSFGQYSRMNNSFYVALGFVPPT